MSSSFVPMLKVLSPNQIGNASLKQISVSDLESKISSLKGYLFYCPPGDYMALRVNDQLVMSDTNFEQSTNYEVVSQATGHILIAGLGLGMILIPIAKKDSVKSITIIEKHQDVIDLVWPKLKKYLGKRANKITIIQSDIFSWKPGNQKWNTIYFDIWPTLCTDNLSEMTTLHRRFASKLVKGGWMNSWGKEYLRYRRRQGY